MRQPKPPNTTALRTWFNRLSTEAKRYHIALDAGSKHKIGIGAGMYRTLERLFNIATLGVTVYLIEYTELSALTAVAFAVVLITGVEGFERFLLAAGTRQGDGPVQQTLDDGDRE